MIKKFTKNEKKILGKHFSNTNKDVFLINTPHQADRGALMSRYSRTTNSMRRVFLNEFINSKNKGDAFYKKVLGQYGDDSIAELGFAHIAVENLSNIAVKTIEDRRIGLSYLEKSSRYVPWNKKIKSEYVFYRDPDILKSRFADEYITSCNLSFDTYSDLLEPLSKYIIEINSIDNQIFTNSLGKQVQFDKLDDQSVESAWSAYQRTIKAKAYDVLRILLPASTLTNVGIAGNGRAFEYLLTILFSSRLHEEQVIANEIKRELEGTIGVFVQRSNDKFGKSLQKYHRELKIASKLNPKPDKIIGSMVKLVKCTNESSAINYIITGLMYQTSTGTSFKTIFSHVKKLDSSSKEKILERYIRLRKNRRHRPPRAFEHIEYTFDIQSDYGIFRDLHRHRALTLQRQLLTCDHGFILPDEIIGSGLDSKYTECLKNTIQTYNRMRKTMPVQAQYVVNFAFNYHYMIKMNLREACHLIELRTTPQGHPEYRKIAQQMYHLIASKHPTLAKIIKFVNLDKIKLERLESEKRIEQKNKNMVKI